MDESVAAKVEKFFSNYQLRDHPKGQILILGGDEVSHIHYLVKGKVKEYEVSSHGDEIILNVFKPPAFFPMSLAINKHPSPHIFETDSAAQIRQAPVDEVVAFIKINPDVMFDLLSRVYRGVDGLLARMARLMSGSAKGRLMFEIVLECRRFGEPQKDGSSRITISETDLGARAGLTRETVSREMHKLAQQELVQLAAGTITVLDLKAFEAKLDEDM